jgi:hypothetical protein
MTTSAIPGKEPVHEEMAQPMSPMTPDDIHDDKSDEQIDEVEPPTEHLSPSEERALYTVEIIPTQKTLTTLQPKVQ